MRTLAVSMFALLALLAFGCGQKAPPKAPAANNKAPTGPAVNVHAGKGGSKGAPDKGKSYLTEYIAKFNEADRAKNEYDVVRRDPSAAKDAINEPYVKWALAVFETMILANKHEKSGHDKDALPRWKQMREMRFDLGRSLGPNDDPRVKAARDEWEKSGG